MVYSKVAHVGFEANLIDENPCFDQIEGWGCSDGPDNSENLAWTVMPPLSLTVFNGSR